MTHPHVDKLVGEQSKDRFRDDVFARNSCAVTQVARVALSVTHAGKSAAADIESDVDNFSDWYAMSSHRQVTRSVVLGHHDKVHQWTVGLEERSATEPFRHGLGSI